MTPDHHLPASAPDIPSHWLQSYPGHLSRTWTLPSGQSLCVRAVRHDDGELEEAFVRGLRSNRPISERMNAQPH